MELLHTDLALAGLCHNLKLVSCCVWLCKEAFTLAFGKFDQIPAGGSQLSVPAGCIG